MKDEEVNLKVINTYKEKFNLLVGYSDHSVSIRVGPYAVAIGAKVIEKHLTLDKTLDGPDQKASLSPQEFSLFVAEIRKVEKYLGSALKELTPSEKATRKSLQKCLVAARKIRQGERFSRDNIVAKRTGGVGISPRFYLSVIGRKSAKDYEPDDLIEI